MKTERDSGAVAIIVAVMSIVFLLVAALVVDLGMAMQKRTDAQKAVDLAALAGGQDLPDKATATDSVADYLLANGWGTDAEGEELTKAELITNLETPSLEDGYISFVEGQLGATEMKVTAPERNVPFVFAPVAELLGEGLSGTRVAADATVQIRSLKNILPYQIPGGSDPGVLCLKADAGNPESEAVCSERTEGNFGYLDLPRTPRSLGPPERTKLNILQGAQFTPTLIPDAETVLANALASASGEVECEDPPLAGAILANFIAPQDGFNCAPIAPMTNSGPLQDGLIGIGGAPIGRCKGRLALAPPAADSLTISGCTVSPDRFTTFINPASDMSNFASWGPIAPGIANDPRFGVAPVAATKELSRVEPQYPIVRFYGVYYKDFYDVSGNVINSGVGTRISSVSAYVFPLDLIDGVLPNDQGTIPYIGGAKVPVLVD